MKKQISDDIVRQCSSIRHPKKTEPYRPKDIAWQIRNGYISYSPPIVREKKTEGERLRLKEAKRLWKQKQKDV